MNPVTAYQNINLLLSYQGDSISLSGDQYKEVDIENGNIHPKLKEAVTLKTHYAVLNFLTSIQSDEECLNSINLYRHNDPTSLNYSVARFTQSMLGLSKLVIDPCPIMEMIDFVKSKLNILNLESVEEINEYFDENSPEAECSLSGFLNLKFKEYTIDFNELIKLIQNMINAPDYNQNTNSCHILLKKIISLHEDFNEKSKDCNYLTRFLTQQSIQIISPTIKEFTLQVEKMKNETSLEEIV